MLCFVEDESDFDRNSVDGQKLLNDDDDDNHSESDSAAADSRSSKSEGDDTISLNSVDAAIRPPGGEVVRDELVNPMWAENSALGNGEIRSLPPEENQFFKVLCYSLLYAYDLVIHDILYVL